MNLQLSLHLLEARRATSYWDGQALIDWAVDALVAGHDTESLVILAGMDGNPTWQQEDYLQQAVEELELIRNPDKSDLLYRYGHYVARQVLDGELPPRDGLGQLAPVRAASDSGFFCPCELLQEDLVELDNGRGCQYFQVTTDTADNVIRSLCRGVLVAHAIGKEIDRLDRHCFACRTVVRPRRKPAPKRWFFSRAQPQPPECPHCDSRDIAPLNRVDVQEAILRAAPARAAADSITIQNLAFQPSRDASQPLP